MKLNEKIRFGVIWLPSVPCLFVELLAIGTVCLAGNAVGRYFKSSHAVYTPNPCTEPLPDRHVDQAPNRAAAQQILWNASMDKSVGESVRQECWSIVIFEHFLCPHDLNAQLLAVAKYPSLKLLLTHSLSSLLHQAFCIATCRIRT